MSDSGREWGQNTDAAIQRRNEQKAAVRHRLIQDNDCHWFVIVAGCEDKFWQWVEWMETGEGPKPPFDFSENTVDGPHTVTFGEWSENVQ